MAVPKGKFKLSGPVVTEKTKMKTEVLAKHKGISVENYLGRIVSEVIEEHWREFTAALAEEWTGGKAS